MSPKNSDGSLLEGTETNTEDSEIDLGLGGKHKEERRLYLVPRSQFFVELKHSQRHWRQGMGEVILSIARGPRIARGWCKTKLFLGFLLLRFKTGRR